MESAWSAYLVYVYHGGRMKNLERHFNLLVQQDNDQSILSTAHSSRSYSLGFWKNAHFFTQSNFLLTRRHETAVESLSLFRVILSAIPPFQKGFKRSFKGFKTSTKSTFPWKNHKNWQLKPATLARK